MHMKTDEDCFLSAASRQIRSRRPDDRLSNPTQLRETLRSGSTLAIAKHLDSSSGRFGLGSINAANECPTSGTQERGKHGDDGERPGKSFHSRNGRRAKAIDDRRTKRRDRKQSSRTCTDD